MILKTMPMPVLRLIQNYPGFAIAIVVIVATLGGAGSVLLKQSIEYDEAISLLVVAGNPSPDWPEKVARAEELANVFAGSIGPGEMVQTLRDSDVHPPLYFWMLGTWRALFGDGIEVARALSLLCTAGASLILGLIVLGSGGRLSWAMSASLLFTLSPMGIYLATTARPYAVALMLVMGAVLGAIRVVTSTKTAASLDQKPIGIVSFFTGLSAGLAVLANYLAILPAGLLGIWLGLVLSIQRRWAVIVVAAAGAAIPLTAAAYMLLGQIGARPGQLAGFEGWGLLSQVATSALNMFAPHQWSLPLMKEMGDPIALTLTGVVLCLGLLMVLGDAVREPRRRTLWSLFGLLAIGSIVGLVAISALLDKNLVYPRFTYAAIPFLACLAAFSAVPGENRLLSTARRVVLFALIALQAVWVWDAQQGIKGTEEWRRLATAAAVLEHENALVLIDAGYGRGVPASLVYELPHNMKTRVLSKHSSQDDVVEDVVPYNYVLLVPSWQKEGRKRIRALFLRLVQSGEFGILQRVGRHVILEKKT